MGRWSRRSEISSSGEVEDWVGTIISGVGGLAVAVLTLAVAFFFVFPEAGLVAAVDLGLGILDPTVVLVAVTVGCECASVTG
jgi:energy-converting hydrogenase Eha subunit G